MKPVVLLVLCLFVAACSGPPQASRIALAAESPALFRAATAAGRSHPDVLAEPPTAMTRPEAAPVAAVHLGALQGDPPPTDAPTSWFGAEVRAYPAGVIGALYAEAPVNAHEVVTYSLGANHTDRHDYGRHDEEDGSGYGAGVGYRHYLGDRLDGWFVGARLDVWSLKIDWKDDRGTPKSRSGSSNIWVMQPTADLGYGFRVDERSRWNVFASLGAEINVSTAGESVGQGPIGLVGVSWVHGF